MTWPQSAPVSFRALTDETAIMAETFHGTRDRSEQEPPGPVFGSDLCVTAEAVVIRNGLVLGENQSIQPTQPAPSPED